MIDGDPYAGSELAGYRVHEVIGRGGMGVVYRATDVSLDRPVALKVLRDGGALDEGSRDQLLLESRRAASLDHPNVVPVYEAGESSGRLFFAMRFVPGTDLKSLLRREGALEPARAIAIAAQVADALDAAHRRGLVHRDVKPSNVLLDQADEREHAYLADFGLTQLATEHGSTDGHFTGSVDYAAPEQIRGERVDGRADQYGLACLLFECLTGTLPYRGSSDVAAIFAHLQEPPPVASERRVGLPPGIDDVLARGMAKEPGERFGLCSELVDSGRDALGIAAPPAASRRVVFALAALLAVVVAAAAAFALTRGGTAPASHPPGGLFQISPRTNAVVSQMPVAGHPGRLVVTPGGVWSVDFRDSLLWRWQPAAHALGHRTSSGEPRDLAVLGDQLYVAADGDFGTGIVTRYDAITEAREHSVSPLLACSIASGEGVVWATGCPDVDRLSTDDKHFRVLVDKPIRWAQPSSVENVRSSLSDIKVGAGSVWVIGDALDRRLWRLDPRTGHIRATIALPFPPRSLAVGKDAVWITDNLDDRVYPVGIRTNTVGTPIRTGRGAAGVASAAGSLWVVNELDGTLSRIDPRARRAVATIPIGGRPQEVAVGDGSVWVSEDEG